MKKKTWMACLVLLSAICLLYAICSDTADVTGRIKFNLPKDMKYPDLVEFCTVNPFDPWSILLGAFTAMGLLTLNVDAPSDLSEAAAGYPTYLYLILVKKTSLPGDSRAASETNQIEIRLKVNPKTGEIPKQKIKIPKQMTIDPAKGESLVFQMKVQGADIPAGSTLELSFWH